MHDLDSNFKDTVSRIGHEIVFSTNRLTAQTRRQICACDISKFSALRPVLAFDILTLKTFDLDSHFQDQRWKNVHFGPKHPQNRKM
jgi:hypothetical protein